MRTQFSPIPSPPLQGAGFVPAPILRSAPPPLDDQLEIAATTALTRLAATPPRLAPGEKAYAKTGYFEYKLDVEGRVWARWNPTLAKVPFDIPMLEGKFPDAYITHVANITGPYRYLLTYDEKTNQSTLHVTPRNDGKRYAMVGGRLQEDASAGEWHLHDKSGTPKLPKGVRIVDMRVASDIIVLVASNNRVYMYKPTDLDGQTQWADSMGTPFEETLELPKNTEHWTFGVSISPAVSARSGRASFEFMNPFTDIDDNYTSPDGTRTFIGFTATIGAQTKGEIRYWDTGLPADFSRGFLLPNRGGTAIQQIHQAGSTWLAYGAFGGAPKLWTREYDAEINGSCPGLTYVFDPTDNDKNTIYDLAPAKRKVPLAGWRELEFPQVPAGATLTDHIAITTTGRGNNARDISVWGTNADGRIGYWRRSLDDPKWSFVAANDRSMLGKPLVLNTPSIAPLTQDFASENTGGIDGVRSIALLDFHHALTLAEPATLRFTLASGVTADVRLRATSAYWLFSRNRKDDAAAGEGIGEDEAMVGTLEIPEALFASKDPSVQALVERLAPYHHVTNLFSVLADRDHVRLSTNGEYRASAAWADYREVAPLTLDFSRDASGESLYERWAMAPALQPKARLSAPALSEVIRANRALIAKLDAEVGARRGRHALAAIRDFFVSILVRIAFGVMSLFNVTGQIRVLAAVDGLVPRLVATHFLTQSISTPAAYFRARAIIDRNLAGARRLLFAAGEARAVGHVGKLNGRRTEAR